MMSEIIDFISRAAELGRRDKAQQSADLIARQDLDAIEGESESKSFDWQRFKQAMAEQNPDLPFWVAVAIGFLFLLLRR